MTRRQVLLLTGTLPLALALAACGGGGPGGGGEATTLPRLTIAWSARSRATRAPGSALSALARIHGAGTEGSDVVVLARRHTDPAAYVETTVGTAAARLGTFPFQVDFYAQENGLGDIVATAQGSVTLTKGSELPELTTTGRVASVEILPDPTVSVGQHRSLPFSVRTTSGALLALTEGACFWSVTSGSGFLSVVDGLLTGLAPGTARVRATVDGVSSPEVAVPVQSGVTVNVSPHTTEVTLRATQRFSASLTGFTGGDTRVVWSVREGADGGAVTAEGMYTAPTVPGIYHVVATSVYDPGRSGEAEVQVVSGGLEVDIH